MPYPNFHACRLRNPDDFKDGSFRTVGRDHKGKKYNVIMGKLKGDDAMTEQAYRYAKDVWAAEDARDHCKDHGGSFTAASDRKSEDLTMDYEEIDTLLNAEGRAVWTTAYINDLADSCFLYISPGGKKDGDGKTTPRSLRHFPYKDANSKVDLPHLRNALARIPQSNLSQDIKDKLMAKARKILADATGGKKSEDEPEGIERRWIALEDAQVRVAEDGATKLVGYGAVFNSRTNIGWFDEQVAQGCFTDTIAQDDIRGLFNHNPDLILGRNKAKPAATMRLSEDSRGLRFEIDVADTQVGRDVLTSVQRGDVSGCSFSFQTIRDAWDRSDPDHPLRTLQAVRLYDVGPVTFPAYPDTAVAARSLEAAKAAEKPPENDANGAKNSEKAAENREKQPEKGEKGPKTEEKAPEFISAERMREIEKGYRKAGRIINRNRPPEA